MIHLSILKYSKYLQFYGKTVFIITTQFHSVGESSDRIEISSSTCFIDLKNCVTKSRYRSNDSFGNFAFRYLGSDIPTEQSYTGAREIAAYF